MKRIALLVFLLLVCSLVGCGAESENQAPEPTESTIVEESGIDMEQTAAVGRARYAPVTSATTVSEVVGHPAFEGFGQYILPMKTRTGHDGSMPLSNIGSLLPYHGHIQTETTLEVINYLIGQVEAGETVFYDIYNQQQKQADPGKESTGLFFFPGEPGARMAANIGSYGPAVFGGADPMTAAG